MQYKKMLAAVACLISAACTTPAPSASRQMSTYDSNTEYTVEYVADGFTLMVNYRYPQFFVRSSAAEAACKSALTSVANSLAERRQRQLEPVNEQSIQVATSRTGSGKFATCSASAPIAWKR
ncbi:hypothetical protein [Cupriavidus sp. D39]|uniref:hypothetical protein n=1 Tax=Cupriavidus sp. D39 TaxID=2997877 RepID=UPI00226EACDF|nr:hypothetical protein [Cupriavidus sp. D39]MCY0858202.1 hypothetical protein [Cupriavidus sp. D39]